MPRIVLDVQDALVCGSCEFADLKVGGSRTDEIAAYECPECGTSYTRDEANDSTRSPCCGKFGRKAEEKECPDCGDFLQDSYAWETEDGRTVGVTTGERAFVGILSPEHKLQRSLSGRVA